MKKSSLILVVSIAVILFAAPAYFVYGQDEPTEEWVVRYNGPGNGDDYAFNMVVDPAGNVYVTGRGTTLPDSDYATVKYDRNGNQQWVMTYDQTVNSNYYAQAIAVSPHGNVHVTGYSSPPDADYDFVTIKYSR